MSEPPDDESSDPDEDELAGLRETLANLGKPLGMDDRVSLYPLDPVEALRALMKTPPVPDPRRKKKGSSE